MALLCFLLDLRSLPSPMLRELTESLLQLANLFAISSSSSRSEPDCLKDRIGVCYILKNGASSPDDTLLEIAYSPRGSFSLRDFHHAVENLPTDAFIPEVNDTETPRCRDVRLSAVLSDQVLFSWGGKDVMKKVIVLSASASYDLDAQVQNKLMEAANMRVSVEFVMFEQKSNHLTVIEENANKLMRCISEIDCCSLKFYLPDGRVFQSLVRRWLQDLLFDMQEPLVASFCFRSNLICSLNQITCNLYMPVNQMIDGFSLCQTCRCHGVPLEDYGKRGIKEPSCAITGCHLETVIENSMKIGERTILFLPSHQCLTELQQNSSPIKFDITERTKLGTLCESVMMGPSYVVVRSSLSEMEPASAGTDQFELNAQAFQGLCDILHSLDQGLVCLSNWNLETMKEATFPCFYFLQPSCNGSMLLRRLAGSEELLYVPDIKRLITASVSEEIRGYIQISLEKIELKDYNPLMHERGLHQKLNFLVKESFEFGLQSSKPKETACDNDSCRADPIKGIVNSVKKDETIVDNKEAEVAETWEQLVIHEFPESCPSVHVSKAKTDAFSLTLSDDNKPLAAKTSRILERLEVPKQRTKIKSPNTICNDLADDTNSQVKPPIPFLPVYATDQGLTASQLMKPNFSKLKRKRA